MPHQCASTRLHRFRRGRQPPARQSASAAARARRLQVCGTDKLRRVCLEQVRYFGLHTLQFIQSELRVGHDKDIAGACVFVDQ